MGVCRALISCVQRLKASSGRASRRPLVPCALRRARGRKSLLAAQTVAASTRAGRGWAGLHRRIQQAAR
eukprot:scaffold9668_cov35-Tisochrysis_lutea.AAC.5